MRDPCASEPWERPRGGRTFAGQCDTLAPKPQAKAIHGGYVPVSERDVLDALRHIQDPDLKRDIVSLGFVRDVRIEGDAVRFEIRLTTPACPVKDQIRDEAQRAVERLPGVRAAQINMTSEVRGSGAPDKTAIAGVKNLVAIGSGKGGVGKSTVAVNLALALPS